MKLGRLDTCLRVEDVEASIAFYSRLGFLHVEGDPAQGWAVILNGAARIGLFSAEFMGEDVVSLNFRGGNIPVLAALLMDNGLPLSQPAKFVGRHGGTLALRDPDGHLLFLDSSDSEHAELGGD